MTVRRSKLKPCPWCHKVLNDEGMRPAFNHISVDHYHHLECLLSRLYSTPLTPVNQSADTLTPIKETP
jgi:hypothetical protein